MLLKEWGERCAMVALASIHRTAGDASADTCKLGRIDGSISNG